MNRLKILIYLNLENNRIEIISSNINLNNLNFLILNQNFLESLNFLSNLTQLKELYLSNNRIKNVRLEDFENLKNLEILSLAHNSIIDFDQQVLHPLWSLSELNLRNISKQSILDINLNKLPNYLKSIDLSTNFIEKIELTFEKSYVTDFYLSDTIFLEPILNLSVLNGLRTLVIKNSNLNLKHSDLEKVSTISSLQLSLCNLSSLDEYFDLNKFTSLSNLNLSHNLIKIITNQHFKRLMFLISLDLSYNQIEFIENNAFININFVSYIYLNNNKIKYLSFSQVKYLLHIGEINLKNNLLEVIESDQIRTKNRFESMEKIDLSINLIRIFDFSNLFDNALQNFVKIVYLNDNKLTSIKQNHFENFKFLEHLSLQNNLIQIIEPNSFNILKKLKIINLACNLIDGLDKQTFKDLFELEFLNLSRNSLTFLYQELFDDLYRLKILDLSNNNLKIIYNDTFKNQGVLKDLFIQNNSKMILESNQSLNGLKSITNIYLSLNNLLNLQNKASFDKSFNKKIDKPLIDTLYYEAINIISDVKTIDCNLTIYFIRIKVLLNLSKDDQFKSFLNFCISEF